MTMPKGHLDPSDMDRALEQARGAAARHPHLRLLLLFGSRARDSARPESDWDFGYLADDAIDMLALRAELVEGLSSDRIDLADLSRAGGLMRYRAARDGRLLYEREPGCFDRFWLEAVGFWCDAQPVLAASYEEVLARLPR